jgi:glutathione S-transferase
MLPLMLNLYVGRLGEAGAPLQPRIMSEIMNHFGYINGQLEGRDWFVANKFGAADIQMSFPIEALGARNMLGAFPNLARFYANIQARPAYKRALERGGPYELGR